LPACAGGDGGQAGRPILVELLEVFRYCWMVFWNLALFLAFANVLHRYIQEGVYDDGGKHQLATGLLETPHQQSAIFISLAAAAGLRHPHHPSQHWSHGCTSVVFINHDTSCHREECQLHPLLQGYYQNRRGTINPHPCVHAHMSC
jgi:hypothetical protein